MGAFERRYWFPLGFKEVCLWCLLLRERDCFVDAIIRNAGTVQLVPIDPRTEPDKFLQPEKQTYDCNQTFYILSTFHCNGGQFIFLQ